MLLVTIMGHRTQAFFSLRKWQTRSKDEDAKPRAVGIHSMVAGLPIKEDDQMKKKLFLLMTLAAMALSAVAKMPWHP